VVIYLSCQLVHGVTAVDFFISDIDDERVDALIDTILEALADAPFEYSVDDCAAALVAVLRELLDDESTVVH
jgi:hypothetical protein